MAYSTQVLSRATARLAVAREEHESRANARRAQVYRELPRVQTIDKQMQRNMVQAAMAAFTDGAQDAIEQAKNQNKALQAERDTLLAQHFEPGFLDDAPFCPHCGGSGYVGTAMCDCLKAFCVEEQRKELGTIFSRNESFDNFSLEYYADTINPQLGVAPRVVMEKVLKICRDYARGFGADSSNLLMIGGTGLGKTHLALAIGKAVGDMGCSVSYESAAGLLTKLEQAKFNPTEDSRRAVADLENCDLLIIDDLGTELPGQFTTAALYNLLNSRLLAGRPMIVTTNLNVEEAAKRYNPQIASRLHGEFRRLTFVGSDIRILKNAR